MKITDVKTATLYGQTFVQIYTDEEIVGLGECWHGPGISSIILDHFKRILIGQDPQDVERLWDIMYNTTQRLASYAGLVPMSITGLEMALWDILGKALGAPVYRLLGGKFRDKIRIYCDCGGIDDLGHPEVWVEKAQRIIKRGFTALKFDIEGGHSWNSSWNRHLNREELNTMIENVAAVREAIGNQFDFAVDCHMKFDVESSIRLANALEPYDLLWLEDPIPFENADALAKITKSTKTPIATGEHLATEQGFRDIIEKQAVDILHPDFANAGGLSTFKRISNMANIYYIPMAAHNSNLALATIAGVHLCAAIRNFTVMEVHHIESEREPWWDDIVKGIDKPIIKQGYISVPEKPGLGVELDEEVIEKYQKDTDTLFV